MYIMLHKFIADHPNKRIKIWKSFANNNSFEYIKGEHIPQGSAYLFKIGTYYKVHNLTKGKWNGNPFKAFELVSTIGSGNSSKFKFYTVYIFRFNGNFPHIFLNRKGVGYDFRGNYGVKLSLPSEFDKKFDLWTPRKYEIEALEIFTPDVFNFLLNEKWPHDIELNGQELFVFREDFIKSEAELEAEFNNVKKLASYFKDKLNKSKFTQIGDRPHFLNN